MLGGIGKIQSAIATTIIFEKFSPDFLVNIGISGNISPNILHIGDVILPTRFVQSDMYLPFDGTHLDYAKKPIVINNFIGDFQNLNFQVLKNAICITSDAFVDDEKILENFREKYQANTCEMEAFAILSVAREYQALDKCIIIKSVSDGANINAHVDHMNNLELAMQNGIHILEKIISTL